MKIKKLENYNTSENTYIVYNEENNSGFVIDPGYKVDGIIKSAIDDNIKIKYIFITHCHYDHIDSLEELREKTGAKLIASKYGSINIGDPNINLSIAFEKPFSIKGADIILKDGEDFEFDGLNIRCVYTPGHSICSCCYICENNIFSGDTLFLREVGRWDLPTGNEQQLRNSIKNKLYKLNDDFIVHPGHGNSTKIGYEKKFNFYVKE